MTMDTGRAGTRLRERLSEPAMLELTERLIAIPSENPPGIDTRNALVYSSMRPLRSWMGLFIGPLGPT